VPRKHPIVARPSGQLCACGCGEETLTITHPCGRRGRVIGEPNRFLNHHAARLARKSEAEREAINLARSRRLNESRRQRAATDPEYRDRMREAHLQLQKDRNARKKSAFRERVVALVVLERDDGVCGICGRDVDPTQFDVDHIVALANGGEHSYANVQAAHPHCNRKKGVS
jgi:5-methylcytosine-specific restriction endonuclease McrA